jgi:hypothetical protein
MNHVESAKPSSTHRAIAFVSIFPPCELVKLARNTRKTWSRRSRGGRRSRASKVSFFGEAKSRSRHGRKCQNTSCRGILTVMEYVYHCDQPCASIMHCLRNSRPRVVNAGQVDHESITLSGLQVSPERSTILRPEYAAPSVEACCGSAGPMSVPQCLWS